MKIKCGECGAEVLQPHTRENWHFDLICDNCEAECTGSDGQGTLYWSSARSMRIARAEIERQQFSADMNEWYGRGNHPF